MRALMGLIVLLSIGLGLTYWSLFQTVDEDNPALFFVVACKSKLGEIVPVVVLEWSRVARAQFPQARLKQMKRDGEEPHWAGMRVVKLENLKEYTLGFDEHELEHVEQELREYVVRQGSPAMFEVSLDDEGAQTYTLKRSSNGTWIFKYEVSSESIKPVSVRRNTRFLSFVFVACVGIWMCLLLPIRALRSLRGKGFSRKENGEA